MKRRERDTGTGAIRVQGQITAQRTCKERERRVPITPDASNARHRARNNSGYAVPHAYRKGLVKWIRPRETVKIGKMLDCIYTLFFAPFTIVLRAFFARL